MPNNHKTSKPHNHKTSQPNKMNQTSKPTINVQHTYEAGAIIYQVQGSMHVEHHHQAPSYFGSASNVPAAAASAASEADALFKYVPDAKQAAHYAQALRCCTSAREVAFVVKGMYNDHIEDDQQIVKKEFIETLLPMLSFEGKSINRIRACINEIVLGK